MSTKYHSFSGTVEFVGTKKLDRYGNWSLRFKLDDPEKYKKTGIQVTVDDENCVWLKRPSKKLIKDELVSFDPPLITDEEGNQITGTVGKGSKGFAMVRSYDTQKGTGHTWDGLKISELVEAPDQEIWGYYS